MVDAEDLKSFGHCDRVGSSPTKTTTLRVCDASGGCATRNAKLYHAKECHLKEHHMANIPVYRHIIIYGIENKPQEKKSITVHCTMPPEERGNCLCGYQSNEFTTFGLFNLATTQSPDATSLVANGKHYRGETPTIGDVEEAILGMNITCPIIKTAIAKSKQKTS